MPGVLKNALDWLAGGVEMSGKRTALLNATPPAEYLTASLRETLRVLGARIVEEACIEVPLRGKGLEAEAIATEPAFAARLRGMLEALARAAPPAVTP
jgi:NAD(P)H-dependent FMN reductase